MSYTRRNLSVNFRLTPQEYGAINYLRFRKGMNLAHISDILGRSLATIHRVTDMLTHETVDNRGQRHTAYATRQLAFSKQVKTLRLRLKMWFTGLVDTLEEALEMNLVPLALIASENIIEEEDEEPA